MREVAIVSAVRTPVGRIGGVLSGVRPDDLAALVVREAVDRAGIDSAGIGEIVLGCANQAGEDNRNVARMAGLLADLPVEVPGVTVNRLCGSGLESMASAARRIAVGEVDVVVAGGVESMSRAPWAVAKPQRVPPRGVPDLVDTALGWRFVNSLMEERGHTDGLGVTAENLAEEHDIAREDQDAFALASHRKAVAAAEAGRFDDELVAVPVRGGEVTADEGPRPDTSLEALAGLRPVFKDGGTVTAGNSSPLNDGAAATVLVAADVAREQGLDVLATFVGSATAGVPPRIMGIGPVPATARLFDRLGLGFDDVDVVELNEAFAAQSLAVTRSWGLADDDERVNPNGGAIALGHPLGCSGTKLAVTAIHELRRRGGGRALVTMCIGVGQGIAGVLEVPA
ncbi:acetyl-CoA C-acyltransferase [Salsipaludibacter albus]|uniref:thiolase family protein n=1 Tax=Salsipaludibacter albus TaxID=2849650 RepID=UPI001EE40314|nr:acetyl-CoA C-acyltransferase [Salsipaludibacter albus]